MTHRLATIFNNLSNFVNQQVKVKEFINLTYDGSAIYSTGLSCIMSISTEQSLCLTVLESTECDDHLSLDNKINGVINYLGIQSKVNLFLADGVESNIK